MTEQEIKQIVEMTVDNLIERKVIREESNLSYQFMGMKISNHFTNKNNEKIEKALDEIKEDPYKKIIPMYYQDKKSIINIAMELNCDRATISRNKKRLVLKLYRICYGD